MAMVANKKQLGISRANDNMLPNVLWISVLLVNPLNCIVLRLGILVEGDSPSIVAARTDFNLYTFRRIGQQVHQVQKCRTGNEDRGEVDVVGVFCPRYQ